MTQKRILILSSLVVLVLFGALVFYRIQEKNKKTAELKNMQPPATAVVALAPKQGSISDAIVLSGNVVAQEEVSIVSKASGRLVSLNVNEGSTVVKGQLLGSIEHGELNAQLDQARASAEVAKANLNQVLSGPLKTQIDQSQASINQLKASRAQLVTNLEQNQRDLERQQILLADNIGTPQQVEGLVTQVNAMKQQIAGLDFQIDGVQASHQQLLNGSRPEQIASARAQYTQALASINIYQAQMQNYVLVSPINGVVTQKQTDAGNYVSPAVPILTLAKQGPAKVELFLPERDLSKIKLKQTVEMRSSAYPDQVILGSVQSISPVVSSQTRLVKLTVYPNEQNALKAGMLLECRIILAEHHDALTVPFEALIQDQDKSQLYLAADGKVEARTVKLGLRSGSDIEITSGLKKQDRVIVKGTHYVKPGDKVQTQTDPGTQTSQDQAPTKEATHG